MSHTGIETTAHKSSSSSACPQDMQSQSFGVVPLLGAKVVKARVAPSVGCDQRTRRQTAGITGTEHTLLVLGLQLSVADQNRSRSARSAKHCVHHLCRKCASGSVRTEPRPALPHDCAKRC